MSIGVPGRRTGRWIVGGGVLLGLLVGVVIGIGAFTFVYARGASYMTNDPRACANCHVMRDWYDGWVKSSHHGVAVCNDCHTPPGLARKLWVKARNGYHHSAAFTLGGFHEPIGISGANRAVTEEACRHCHSELAAMIEGPHAGGSNMSCIRCHNSVGHLSND
jgi:cytochrome c nitrite reductase small subunit